MAEAKDIKWQEWVNQLGDIAVNWVKSRAEAGSNYNPNIVPTQTKPYQPDFSIYLPVIVGIGIIALLLIKK